MDKETIIRKLTSRKLWAAIVGFVTGLLIYMGRSEADAEQIGSLIMMGASVVAYIVGEGLADAGNGGATYLLEPEEEHPPEGLNDQV